MFVFNVFLTVTAAYFAFKNLNRQLLFFISLGSFVKNCLLTIYVDFVS